MNRLLMISNRLPLVAKFLYTKPTLRSLASKCQKPPGSAGADASKNVVSKCGENSDKKADESTVRCGKKSNTDSNKKCKKGRGRKGKGKDKKDAKKEENKPKMVIEKSTCKEATGAAGGTGTAAKAQPSGPTCKKLQPVKVCDKKDSPPAKPTTPPAKGKSETNQKKDKKENKEKKENHGGAMFRNLAYLFIPLVLAYSAFVMTNIEERERLPFVPYEYLRKRDKVFPWRDGNQSFFHNTRVNALPEGYEDEIEERRRQEEEAAAAAAAEAAAAEEAKAKGKKK